MDQISSQALASDVLARHSIMTMPVPVGLIAHREGAKVRRQMGLADGALTPLRSGSGYVITVNSKLSDNRQRFTLAHELGHLLLDRWREQTPVSRRCVLTVRAGDEESETDNEERFCNSFASHLLMPGAAFESLHDLRTVRIRDIERAARDLSVSVPALAWQVIESAVQAGGGMLYLRLMGKPTDPNDVRLRVNFGVIPGLYVHRFAAVPKRSPIQYAVKSWDEKLYQAGLSFVNLPGLRNVLVKKIADPGDVLVLVMPAHVVRVADEPSTYLINSADI